MLLGGAGGFAAAAEPLWVPLQGQAAAAPVPPGASLTQSPGQALIHVTVAGFSALAATTTNGSFSLLDLPGAGVAGEIGEPQLPALRWLVSIPAGADLNASLQGSPRTLSLATAGVGLRIMPRQRPVPKVPGAAQAAPFDFSVSAYGRNAFSPSSPLAVADLGIRNGRRLKLVEFAPLAYNPAAGQLKAYPQASIVLALAAPTSVIASDAIAILAGPGAAAPSPSTLSGGRLLVITSDAMATNLAAFAAHKAARGWTVDIAATGATGTNTTSIRSYVAARYADPGLRPDALLLVGDVAQVPRFVGTQADNPDTDLYYACMDGAQDWQPEFPVGRLSVTGLTQLAEAVAKIAAYESASTQPWMSRATFMASEDNYTVTEGTHNSVIAEHMGAAGYASDKLYTHTYGATTPQVSAAFNEGRALGIYSGHGSQTYWADGPVFTQADVRALTNSARCPFVASFACLTGQFSLNECFAETWLRAPGAGAVAVWASSVTSYWTEDDILERRLFTSVFTEGERRFGFAARRAKELYLLYFGLTSTTRRYFEMYNLFGDPTIALAFPGLMILTPSALAPAQVSIPYSGALAAAGGTPPYTWSLQSGSLPPGLGLTAGGSVTGAPLAAGAVAFTARATDSAGTWTSRTFALSVVAPLAIVTPDGLPAAPTGLPYAVSLVATGGTPPYTWRMLDRVSYPESTPAAEWLGEGVASNWAADDGAWAFTLPWPFPFYDSVRTSLWVCSNGFVDFGASNTFYKNSAADLLLAPRIAPLWDDLRTDRTGRNIYVRQDAGSLTIRWAAETYAGGYAVNVELILFRTGDIRFNYSGPHTGLSPTVGLSAGDGVSYTLGRIDGSNSLPGSMSLLFTRIDPKPQGLSLAADGTLSGTPAATGSYAFSIGVDDSSAPSLSTSRCFRLDVVRPVMLTVASDRGSADPAVGTHVLAEGRACSASMAGSPLVTGAVRYACSGWMGTGSVPLSGAGTNTGPLVLTEDSTIGWLWSTDYYLNVEASGTGGWVTVSSGWYPAASTVTLSAVAIPYHAFVEWQGDVPKPASKANPVELVLDTPRSIAAVFAPALTALGTPEAWLAGHGFTDFAVADTNDADRDGMPTWQEYVANTDPTNGSSWLGLTDVRLEPTGSAVLRWQSAQGRTYEVLCATGRPGPEAGAAVASGLPATPPLNTYTAAPAPSLLPGSFFRVRVE